MKRIYTFNTISGYLSVVKRLRAQWEDVDDVWFRGIDDVAFSLEPRISWMEINEEKEDTLNYGFTKYFQMYAPDLDIRGYTDLYILMQHYGLPTRLLDWTMSPMVALYFALENEKSNAPGVWMMSPERLNEISGLGFVIFTEPYKGDGIAGLPKALGGGEGRVGNTHLMGFIHQPSNPRVAAQKGCFTIHGRAAKQINQVFSKNRKQELAKIRLSDNTKRSALLGELRELGFKEDDIYQDWVFRPNLNTHSGPK